MERFTSSQPREQAPRHSRLGRLGWRFLFRLWPRLVAPSRFVGNVGLVHAERWRVSETVVEDRQIRILFEGTEK